ncbi:ComEA family DNA-binding protein [Ramlibacter montanisoli]|uniref:Helix-hairpin-helix domain-containing protein n=1 Tax=Ramlibacter montanisoli TaxID=2732512 RepID=A0A849KGA9_9BURK|nr:helix-hairpin-helix domain-containing protein [Ramlibacter montanisoli]NNU43691.1 helix-hairpin-helix domain-containing protein [Ramlibacter montanisoli]
MLKKILAIVAMLYAAAAFAAVDVNKATAAELDGIKGIGPVMSKRIIDERKKGEFKSWDDLIARVKGISDGNAAKFDGLTVKGAEFKKAAAKKEAKADAKADKKEAKADAKDTKKDAKADKKDTKAAATPATPATPAKPATATTAATPAKPATPATPAASAKK